ncbi:protocadherin beta-16-like [Xyrichtys novacula]|uniref:Protocadherin beta-16-like n=1 Tax=Xyrichtys novacula TaxID=13765 RepID=A0AAV1FCD4_XYRNO|nr:protocadherin beta-16-like [Xyrichtys novacula]
MMDLNIVVMFKLWSFCFLLVFCRGAYGDLSYSFQEEMKRGSVIGNLAKDLGLQTGALSNRRARIDTEGTDTRYCDINLNNGELIVADRIDREGLCGEKASCILKQELVLENPLELHRITLHIQDINDNSPQFKDDSFNIEIRESADRGARFVIEEAHDADVGQNSVQQYSLMKNDNFILASNGNTIELVLDKELDREKQKELNLLLSALDGGSPQRSGTVVIHVTVLDANDNAPVFSQAVYKASLPENSPVDTVVVRVSATDADEGVNGDVSYEFGHVSEDVKKLFSIDRKLGEIRVIGAVDYESTSSFEIRIQAKDGLGLSSYTKVPELKDISYDEKNSKLTSYLIIALVCVSTFFLTFIIIILGVRFCRRRKPRLLFDGAVAIPSAYLPPNYADVDGTGTLRSAYNYDAYLTTGSRTSDFKFVSSYNDNTLPADQTLRKSPSDFAEVFGDCDDYPEVPELKDISYDEKNSKLTSYLIIALVCVSTFFLTFIIIILGVRFCRRRKPRLLFDGAVAIPSAYLPPNYADVDGTGTLRSAYNYDAYLTTGSRTSDFKFVSSYNDNTLPADQTLRKSPSDFAEVFGDCDDSPEVGTCAFHA